MVYMSLIKRIDKARNAYAQGDKKSSAVAHAPERIRAAREEHGGAGSEYLGELVYGGLDGIITTFAVVSGVAGADLETGIIIILGIANLIADGFSMATGAYLSAKSENEFYEYERSRELWEVEHFPEGERAELLEVYKEQGYPEADAQQLLEIVSQDKQRWVDAMMVSELGLMKAERNPLWNGLATLVAFIIAGSVPLLVYFVGLQVPISGSISFPISIGLTALALFGLGAAKVAITRQNPWRGGLEMLLVGGLAAGVAFVIGSLLRGLA